MSLSTDPFTLQTLESLTNLKHHTTPKATPIASIESEEKEAAGENTLASHSNLHINATRIKQLTHEIQWIKKRVAHHSKSRSKSNKLLAMLDDAANQLTAQTNSSGSHHHLIPALKQKWMNIIREAARERQFITRNNAKTTYTKTTSYQVILAKLSGSLWPQIIDLNAEFIDKSTSTPPEEIQKKIAKNKNEHPGLYDLTATKHLISTNKLTLTDEKNTGSARLYEITDPEKPKLENIIDQLKTDTEALLETADKTIKPILQEIQALLGDKKPNIETLFNKWMTALAETFPHEDHNEFLTQYARSSWIRVFNSASIDSMRHRSIDRYPTKTHFWLKIPYAGQSDTDQQPCHGFRDPSRPLLSNIRSITAIFFITKLMQKQLTLTLEVQKKLKKDPKELAILIHASQGTPLLENRNIQKIMTQLHNIDASIQKISDCRQTASHNDSLAKREDLFAQILTEQMKQHESEHPLFAQFIDILERIDRENTTPHERCDDGILTPGELSANTQRIAPDSIDDAHAVAEFVKLAENLKPTLDLTPFDLESPADDRPMDIAAISLSPHKGTSLRQCLVKSSNTEHAEKNSTQYIIKLTKLLRQLHENQLAHPDISLENILINESNTLTLCDDEGMSVITAPTTKEQEVYNEIEILLHNSLNQLHEETQHPHYEKDRTPTTPTTPTCTSYLFNYCTLFRWLCCACMTVRDNLFWDPLNQRSAPPLFTQKSPAQNTSSPNNEHAEICTT